MLMLTTTAIDVDEELLNRCLVLTVDESREQTHAIHARQRARGRRSTGCWPRASARAIAARCIERAAAAASRCTWSTRTPTN